jgi:hypothetical protein
VQTSEVISKARSEVVSIVAVENSELHVIQGFVWATLDTGGDDAADNYGDHFLEVGQKLTVLKGQHLVFESAKRNLPVFFDFLPI